MLYNKVTTLSITTDDEHNASRLVPGITKWENLFQTKWKTRNNSMSWKQETKSGIYAYIQDMRIVLVQRTNYNMMKT